jgi:transposase
VRAFRFGVDCDVCTDRRALVPHRNAPLTETGRLRLARCVVEDGWTLRRAAERFQVSPTTAQRWADRYRQLGETGMADRSSRPHHCPRRIPTRTERRIIKVRIQRLWGPARIAHLLHLVPSTVHRVLTRYHLARLTHLDRATGRVIRRYEHDGRANWSTSTSRSSATSPTAAAKGPRSACGPQEPQPRACGA